MDYVFWVMLTLGAAAMFATMFVSRRMYQVSAAKCLAFTVILTFAGVLGAKIMYFIESGKNFSGESFYGALFFAPLLMMAAAKLFRTPVSVVLDLCAPAECVMLALLKIRCTIAGCCGGKILCVTQTGEIRFPSQIVETVTALVLMVLLLLLMRRPKYRGCIYPVYMVLYGTTRFILNCMRDVTPVVWILAIGHIWSLLSVVVGAVVLIRLSGKRKVCHEENKKPL